MSASDEILGSLPIGDLARRVGASPDEVQQAAAAVVPALLGGMQANAGSGGAGSLLDALGQHDPGLVEGGVDLDQVDPADGEKITSHVFGGQQEEVASRLGASPLSGSTVGSDLVKRLMPILAPIVLSWLAKQVLGGRGSSGTSSASGGSGGLQDVLGQVLGSATGGSVGGTAGRGGVDAGSIIGDVLGGILGGGRR